MIRVFVGYDRRIGLIYDVFAHSVMRHSSEPVSFTPLNIQHLARHLDRELDPLQSTEFSFSRFLTPFLCNYEGWALFFDNDMLMLDDIAKLWALRDERYAVQVVKHHHQPQEDTKFLGEAQTKYEKKNWSSVMLFNCVKCRALTPEYVSSASGLDLHQFKWLAGDHEIGELPHRWNHLVDYDPELPAGEISNLHYTLGGPYYFDYRNCDYADLWLAEREHLLHIEQRKLTGPAQESANWSRQSPSPRYTSLIGMCREMHFEGEKFQGVAPEQTFPGQSLIPHVAPIKRLIDRVGAGTVLDYGCGKGAQYRPMTINTTDGRVFNSVAELWGTDITLYDPAYTPFSTLPEGRFDAVISTDVLEHCPEEDLPWIIDELFSYANKLVYANVACYPAGKRLPNGENAHVTVRPLDYWSAQFQRAADRHPEINWVLVVDERMTDADGQVKSIQRTLSNLPC